jgi:hypothetical protein
LYCLYMASGRPLLDSHNRANPTGMIRV